MNIPHYHINIFWSEEDACYVADIPDLKHCTGQGDSPREALEDVLETRDAWLDACSRWRRRNPRANLSGEPINLI